VVVVALDDFDFLAFLTVLLESGGARAFRFDVDEDEESEQVVGQRNRKTTRSEGLDIVEVDSRY